MDRLTYFIRRILLVVPTFIGITFLCFTICQFVPGGPIERKLAEMRSAPQSEAGGGIVQDGSTEQMQELRAAMEKEFGFDKPLLRRYWWWLWDKRLGLQMNSYRWRGDTCWDKIHERFRVSVIFGVTGFFLTYLICIPLGISKALRHGGTWDVASSILVFVGYAIPAFAFGMLLKLLLSGTTDSVFGLFPSLNWFPAAGFTSHNFDQLSIFGKLLDIAWHMVLPLICYMISSFAVLTILMKNSLLEQISQDYVRTVLAKGGSMRLAVWRHAVRNSMIPIATGIGGILTVLFAGNVLIENVFEIPGMGQLSLIAIQSRDYAVFMAILSITSILGLLGNIISDLAYVIIDPRITFKKN